MNETIVPVVLSGGAGTRLWPLSRAARPKQFLPLVGRNTLFQETFLRLGRLPGEIAAPLVVCNGRHGALAAEQLGDIGMTAAEIVLEPEGRNTAPAVAVAALLACAQSPDSDPILLVLPADHVIAETDSFLNAVETAVEAARLGRLVTFGIVPDRPETGYGYLRRGAREGDWHVLDEFVEKPDLATAERYLATGGYLWNSGMFVLPAGAVLSELEAREPAMLEACKRAVADAERERGCLRLSPAFLECRSDSIDYAVMEKTGKAAVVALDAGWSDVGSFAALFDVLGKDAEGNALVGDALLEGTRGCYVASTSRLVAVVGLENVVVVETADAVLVLRKDEAQRVKAIVDVLGARGREER